MESNVRKFPVGGVYLPEEKFLTNDLPIKNMDFPQKVIIPVKQHIGVPAKVKVDKGQYVQRGECIADNADQGISARIHASISGKIIDIEERLMFDGSKTKCVIIEKKEQNDDELNQEKEENSDYKKLNDNDQEVTPENIVKKVKMAGIAGMGGAGFPTHIKLMPPPEKKIDTILINGAECEPYITADDRVMQEKTEVLYRGLELIRIASGAKKGLIACENNKPKAIEKLKRCAPEFENLDCVVLDSRYPHGAEKHLIKAVLNREVPRKGLPMDIGVIVNNVQTTVAIAEAVDPGKPLIERVVTVSGRGLVSPSNIRAPIGTTVRDIIDFCGGIETDNYLPVMGGPMTGFKIEDQQVPITKTNYGLIILNEKEYEESESRVCIRCGKCVDACPVYITPNRITDFINNNMFEEAEDLGLSDCIECGACAFVCPSKRPLLRWLKEGKAALNDLDT